MQFSQHHTVTNKHPTTSCKIAIVTLCIQDTIQWLQTAERKRHGCKDSANWSKKHPVDVLRWEPAHSSQTRQVICCFQNSVGREQHHSVPLLSRSHPTNAMIVLTQSSVPKHAVKICYNKAFINRRLCCLVIGKFKGFLLLATLYLILAIVSYFIPDHNQSVTLSSPPASRESSIHETCHCS